MPGRESGKDADPSVVPTERPVRQLSGPLPGHLAQAGLDGLLKWSLHIHPGVRAGRQGTGSSGECWAGRSGTEVLGLPRPLPPPPCTLCGHPCPNLTFIGKSIRPGGSFQTSQKTQWGRGSCGLGHSTKTPGLSRGDGIPWEKKLRTLGPLTSKASDKMETASQLVLRGVFCGRGRRLPVLVIWRWGPPGWESGGWRRAPTPEPLPSSHKHLDIEKAA